MGSLTATPLPVVDLTGGPERLSPGSDSWNGVSKEIIRALEDHGGFIAEYDQVPQELPTMIFTDMTRLFQLPYETKIKNTSKKAGHGYFNKISNVPLHEGMGIDHATDLEECRKLMELMWPSGDDAFSENVNAYAKKVAQLEQTVARVLFESYGVEKHYAAHREATTYLLRLVSYEKPDNEEDTLAFFSHTDKSFITILHQNNVKGLELRTKDGDWITFEPSPSSFVVLAGDVSMAWSNDRIKSLYHRVIMRGKETRYSLGLFSIRNGVMEVPKELIDEGHPLLYKPFDHQDLLLFYDTLEPKFKSGHTFVKMYCGIDSVSTNNIS